MNDSKYDISIDKSGLSQWVVFCGKPFSVEIFRRHCQNVWTVEIIDAVEKEIVWKSTAQDDTVAFIDAITHIHKLPVDAKEERKVVYLN